jgi:hypothetical protein
MAETFITDQDRTPMTSVYSGHPTEDIITRASSNLSTLPGQMRLLDMQQKALLVNKFDRERRSEVFKADKEAAEQREIDSYVGFLGDLDKVSPEERPQATQSFFNQNPNLFKNSKIAEVTKNYDETQTMQRKAIEENTVLETAKIQANRMSSIKKATEDDNKRMVIESKLNAEKSQNTYDSFKEQIETAENLNFSNLGTTLGKSNLDPEMKKLAINLVTTINDTEDRASIGSVLKVVQGLSAGSVLDRTYESKIKKHGEFLNTLNSAGIKLNINGNDDEFDLSVADAAKKIQSIFSDNPKEGERRISNLYQAAQDIDEARTAKSFTDSNINAAKEKFTQLREISKKAALGDIEAKHEMKLLLGELSVIGGELDGNYQSTVERRNKEIALEEQDVDMKIKMGRINKLQSEINSSQDKNRVAELKVQLSEEMQDTNAVKNIIKTLEKQAESASGDQETEIQDRIKTYQDKLLEMSEQSLNTSVTGSSGRTSSNASSGAVGGSIPRK